MAAELNVRAKGRAKTETAVGESKESMGTTVRLLPKLKELVVDSTTRRNDLRQIHAAGQIIQRLYTIEKQSREGGAQYGKQWMHNLANRVRPDWMENDKDLCGFLYRAREFAKWPKQEVSRLAAAKGRSGQSLSWGHALRLFAVADEKKRSKLVRKWCKHEFSLRAWQREIQKADEIRQRGRPPERPHDIADALYQALDMADRWIMWQRNNLAKAPEGKEPFLVQFGPKLRRLMAKALPVIEGIREVAKQQWRKALRPTSKAGATLTPKTSRHGKVAARRS
jgi:hypothetical protein